MWSCVCLKCHCIYTLCKAKTCIKMHAMKFNNSNTFIPHQTIFSNHANLLKASFTLILILCFVSPMVFWNIGIVWPDEFLSSFKIYRHEKHRPRRPRKLVCLDYQKSWQNYGRKNIHIEYRIRWQKIIHTNEKEKFSLFSKWRVTENKNDCLMSIFLLWICIYLWFQRSKRWLCI